MPESLTIWFNAQFPPEATERLRSRLSGHRILPSGLSATNLTVAGPDPLLEQADVAYGQPDPQQIMALPRLRWIHLTSAGYTRYDRPEIKAALHQRGAILTNSSSVYSEPCAQHVLAMMLAFARQLPQCQDEQRAPGTWKSAEHRILSRLLLGQSVLLLGFGAIGRRLAEMLHPLGVKITAVRRNPTSDPGVRVEPTDRVDELIPEADHVVDILPANPSTRGFMSASRLARMKPEAIFYNIGRGSTVDQAALLSTLQSRRIAGAYLDVTDPEPLPKYHPLWAAPNCYITPHTAGGHDTEFVRLVDHFLENLKRFEKGNALKDQVT